MTVGLLVIAFSVGVGVPGLLLWLVAVDERRHRVAGWKKYRELLDSGVLDR